MTTAVWLRLTDLGPLESAGVPDYGNPGGFSYAHINGETGLIVARVNTNDGSAAGRAELWCIPPGGQAVCVASDEFDAGSESPPPAPMCHRMERVLNVRAPL